VDHLTSVMTQLRTLLAPVEPLAVPGETDGPLLVQDFP